MLAKTKLPQASKTSHIQQKISSKIIRTGNIDKYAGKHSAEVIVDRSKLPISMQNISPPPESLSTSSSTRQQSVETSTLITDDNAGNLDFEYNATTRNSSRRNATLESPTKQFYNYGFAGFDL